MPDLCCVIMGLRTDDDTGSLRSCPSSGTGSVDAVFSSGTGLKCWLFLQSGTDGV